MLNAKCSFMPDFSPLNSAHFNLPCPTVIALESISNKSLDNFNIRFNDLLHFDITKFVYFIVDGIIMHDKNY